jgi:hypothetical protein
MPGTDSLVFEFIEGESAGGLTYTLPEAVTTATGGRELGLLDYLIGNTDRHGLNVRLRRDGSVVGIDHGSPGVFSDDVYMSATGGKRLEGGSAFSEQWLPKQTNKYGEIWRFSSHSFTNAELDNAIRAARAADLPPSFLAQVEERVALIRSKAAS